MDKAYMCYDYIANLPLMVASTRPRFFGICREEGITDLYMKLRCDNINKLTTYKDLTASFIAEASKLGIRVWLNLESPWWSFTGDGCGDTITSWGPRLTKMASEYNLSVVPESRFYGIWTYVDFQDEKYTPPASWEPSAALVKSMRAADNSGMKFCYWLGWHDVTQGLPALAAIVDMFELDGYAPTVDKVIERLQGRHDAIAKFNKPYRVSLSTSFTNTRPYTNYIKSGWDTSTQKGRLKYLKEYFNPVLVAEVNKYFSNRHPNHYRGVGIQDFGTGPDVAYPLDYIYQEMARYYIWGEVWDASQPIIGAKMTLTCGGTILRTETGSNGRFEFYTNYIGEASLRCEKEGYSSTETYLEFPADHGQKIDLRLSPIDTLEKRIQLLDNITTKLQGDILQIQGDVARILTTLNALRKALEDAQISKI